MKMTQGASLRARVNSRRTRAAPRPANFSWKLEPETERKGTSASHAAARASRVLPVPGGPERSMPRGGGQHVVEDGDEKAGLHRLELDGDARLLEGGDDLVLRDCVRHDAADDRAVRLRHRDDFTADAHLLRRARLGQLTELAEGDVADGGLNAARVQGQDGDCRN